MKPLIAAAVLSVLAAFRAMRFVIGVIGLQQQLGVTCAVIGAACLLLLRFTPPIRIGAFLAAMSLWRWPWYAALILAAPRVLLVLPGLVSTFLAERRHPRPIWPSVRAA